MSPTEMPIADLAARICEVPAPTFHEGERAAFIASLWQEAGLDVQVDDIHNVVARVEGGTGPHVLLAAHSDTVFPLGTDVTVQRTGSRWLAPGLGDNSASVAVLTWLARQLPELDGPLPRITLASPVGEEGRGDLRGMRRIIEDHGSGFDCVIAVDGALGRIVDQAVGSKRYEISFSAVGGHSWGDYGSPSAVHAMADAMSALNRLRVPVEPRASYNIGTVSGGTSINAIAESARFDLDLRSVDPDTLARLEADSLQLIRDAAGNHDVRFDIRRIGDRPAARVDNSVLVRMARGALADVGLDAATGAASTDANAALAAGIPAICLGVYEGGDAHRLSEWIDPRTLDTGYRMLVSLLGRLTDYRSSQGQAPVGTLA